MAKLLRWLGITLLELAVLAIVAAFWMGLDFGSRPAKSVRPLAVASDVRFVEANGIRFAFLEAGKGPLVLLFHGYPETARSWSAAQRKVAGAGYRVVAPFMRGYPPTSLAPDGDYCAATLGRDVIGLIDALGADSAVVVGHDWGALAVYAAVAQENELRVLRRIAAPASVRLACQLRPLADLSVTPLLPASATAADAMERAEHQRSEERAVAVLFADMRGFTRLAESRLPYDVVFVLNRYREEMAHAIESAGGVVNEFVGDDVMALFGLDSDVETGCRQAMAAARAMLDRLRRLNGTLAAELGEPLRIGIGIHAGPVIVGEMGYANLKGITVVGDVVNTASRLEEMTKRFGAQVVMSEDAASHVGDGIAGWQRHEVEVRGRLDTMTVLVSDTAPA